MARKPAAGTAQTDDDDDDAVSFAGNGGGSSNESGGGEADTEDGDGIVVDLSNTSDAGFKAMPAGIYNASVDSLEYGLSQRSGNKMWTWIFELEDGEFAKRKVYYHTTFNEGGLPRVKRCLARIKDDAGFAQELLNQQFNPKKVAEEGRLLGARCRIRLGVRRYEGNLTNDVKDVLAPTGGSDGGFQAS